MLIDFENLKIVCISLKSSDERRSNFKQMANRLNFKNWSFYDGIVSSDHIEGCAMSQINVLKENMDDNPVLIVEDDIQETEFYKNTIDLSDITDMDALYLGYSNWAAHPIRAQMSLLSGPSTFVKIKEYYKITNVTSAHAIIYISKKYKQACADGALNYLTDPTGNRHCDVVYAKLQNEYNVFATPKHFFYQNCPRNKVWTNTPIE
jgi:hypothetical protein